MIFHHDFPPWWEFWDQSGGTGPGSSGHIFLGDIHIDFWQKEAGLDVFSEPEMAIMSFFWSNFSMKHGDFLS